MRRAAVAVLGALAVAGVTACGSDDSGGGTTAAVQAPQTAVETAQVPTTTTEAPATTPTATTESPPTATTPTATTGVPPAKTTTGESGAGGAGDEEAARVPVALTLGATGALSPTTVTIPAFLAVTISVKSAGPAATVKVATPDPVSLSVPAGGTATKSLTGLKPGDYAVTAPRGGRATLHVVSGGDPGP